MLCQYDKVMPNITSKKNILSWTLSRALLPHSFGSSSIKDSGDEIWNIMIYSGTLITQQISTTASKLQLSYRVCFVIRSDTMSFLVEVSQHQGQANSPGKGSRPLFGGRDECFYFKFWIFRNLFCTYKHYLHCFSYNSF